VFESVAVKKGEWMNKIILQAGLLVFFFSVIYFTQKGVAIESVLLNSFVIFIMLTVLLSLIAIGLIKSINKNSFEKINRYSNDLAGTNENE
jgi:amino acid transporter